MGIGAVVCLVEEWEFEEVGWSFRDYARELAMLGMELLHAPTRDGYAPADVELLHIVRWIDERVSRGVPTLVHCHGGIGRSPTVLAAYIMYSMGLGVDDALRLVSEANGDVSLTDEQYMALISFEYLLNTIRRASGG